MKKLQIINNTSINQIVFFLICCTGIPFFFRILKQKSLPTVILFHDLDKECANKVLSWLKRKYTFIEAMELIEALEEKNISKLPSYSMVLTFDDGRRSNLKLTELSELGIPATNFVSSAENRLDGCKFVDPDEIINLASSFDIQLHTHTHPDMSKLTYSEQMDEIKTNLLQLKYILHQTPCLLAYPYGKYNRDTIRAVKNHGLRGAFTVNSGYIDNSTSQFEICRLCISDKPSLFELSVKSSGFWHWLFPKQGYSNS